MLNLRPRAGSRHTSHAHQSGSDDTPIRSGSAGHPAGTANWTNADSSGSHEAQEAQEAQAEGDAALDTLTAYLERLDFDAAESASLGSALGGLIEHGFDSLPLPGGGMTLLRWRMLAAVAARDLGLVKLFEGHTDALAILAELRAPRPHPASRWGVWAAQARGARVTARPLDSDQLLLTGTKPWCSGAGVLTHALVTVWAGDEPVLAAVSLKQPTISIDAAPWRAVGMRATASADVHFDRAIASRVGVAHAYVQRPGFWQGAAGIAACWYGAAAGIGRRLAEAVAERADAHRLAHLGAVDSALAGARAVLRETAERIDTHPNDDAQYDALRARLAVEAAASAVIEHVGRALGAAPFCRDARFARALADLPVFLRQSHAEQDMAALGEGVVSAGNMQWSL